MDPGCRGGATRNYASEIVREAREPFKAWIPAFAGMTAKETSLVMKIYPRIF